MWDINVFIMQIDYVKISCKEDVHICRTNFAKQMEQNLHETTSWWKTYGKRLFSEDLEVRDVVDLRVPGNYNIERRPSLISLLSNK
jgi:hypothetical protein